MRYDGGPESGCFCPCMSFADLFVICREKSAFRKERKDGRIRCPLFFLRAAGGAGIQLRKDAGAGVKGTSRRGRSGEDEGWRGEVGGSCRGRRWRKDGAFLPVRGTEGGRGMRGRNGWRRLFIPIGRLMVACPGAASCLPTRMLLAGVFRKGAADGKAWAGERNARGGIVRAD